MQAIANRILVGADTAHPLYSFANSAIVSVGAELAVALSGDELFIDNFEATTQYEIIVRLIFRPTDYDGIKTADNKILAFKPSASDLRLPPYETPIWFYTDNTLVGKFYSKSVERIAKDKYKITAMSAIGFMDKRYHKGGIYTGQTFSAVLTEMLGNNYSYSVDSDVAAIKVYGWLPYDTVRNNLYQLVFAYNVAIKKNATTGAMVFSFLENGSATAIPQSRIYVDGSVEYPEPASRVEVTEHIYQPVEVEPQKLYDDASIVLDHATIQFDEPVIVASLTHSDGLTVHSSGVNYAIVSGSGTLYGQPYTHLTRIISETNSAAPTERVISVENATLVNMMNSPYVLSHLVAYYSSARTISTEIVLNGEKCGGVYSFDNPYYERETAFLQRMSFNVSSFIKASCEMIADYSATGQGAAFQNMAIMSGSGTWTIPESVFDKEQPLVRAILIGGGQGGYNGTSGNAGEAGMDNVPATGGAGGLGGTAGTGGKIQNVVIDVTGLSSLSYSCGAGGASNGGAGGASTLTADVTTYTSADGDISALGVMELTTGIAYALPGVNGVDGGAGGKGGINYYDWADDKAKLGVAGDGVSFGGTTYTGGEPSLKNGLWYPSGESGSTRAVSGGQGGGGAAVGHNGGVPNRPCPCWANYATLSELIAARPSPREKENNSVGTSPNYTVYEWNGTTWEVVPNGVPYGMAGAIERAGNGATPVAGANGVRYGCGGSGGHGGGGGGGACNFDVYNVAYSAHVGGWFGTAGTGGAGSAGGTGGAGCIILYW